MDYSLKIRRAVEEDLGMILEIYNQGIEDRIATLESAPKDMAYMQDWFKQHEHRYSVLVAELEQEVVGWVSLNPYSNRCAYDGVADLSIYIRRDFRGKGVGTQLLHAIEERAAENQFYKIILYTFASNVLGQGLYKKCGYREVGILEQQGRLDGQFIDILIMEKLLLNR